MLLERSKDFTRSIATTSPQGIDTRVTSLDGVQLIEVWDDARFKTKFDFTTGFVKAEDGKDINFLIVAKTAVIAKAKLTLSISLRQGNTQKVTATCIKTVYTTTCLF